MLTRSLFLAFTFCSSVLAQESNIVTLPSGESHEQHMIRDSPPGTHFDAGELILYGGTSDHYNPPPTFCLRSSSRWNPEQGVGYHDTSTLESWELPNEELYPLQLRDMDSPSLSGVSVIGTQSKVLPWRVVKAMWDGDALHVKGCTGHNSVSEVYFENVEDGFGPSAGLDNWRLSRAWMKDIRDDAIENDDFVDGEIVDCLIDGCFVFLSQRASEPVQTTTHTKVENCLVRVSAQAHDGIEQREWRDRNIKFGEDGIGRAPGMIFKWEEGAGTVEVKNCIFVMGAVSVNGTDDMTFPPGNYENVTLIWTGTGNYPAPLPRGVTQTNDITLWEKAKADWLRENPTHPGHAFNEEP